MALEEEGVARDAVFRIGGGWQGRGSWATNLRILVVFEVLERDLLISHSVLPAGDSVRG